MSLFGISMACAAPPNTQCSTSEARAAEDVVGKLETWAAVHDAYQQFSHCDDGSIGEGFSESITLLLASRRSQFDELNRFAKHDKKFEAFVLRHIDATVPNERLDIVRRNALRECRGGEKICKKIAKCAANARREGLAPHNRGQVSNIRPPSP